MERNGCVFCQIVAGDAEASIPYQDDETVAFMDVKQFREGHTLVVPRRHVKDLFELDEPLGGALMTAVVRVGRAVRDALRPDGLYIWQANGAPWQEVFHVHFHVLPRWEDDGVLRFAPPTPRQASRLELDEQSDAIRAKIR